MKNLTSQLIETVESAIERNALANGNITYASVSSIIKEQQEQFNTRLQSMEDRQTSNMNTILQALQGNKHSHSHQVDPTFQNNLQGSSLSLTNQRWYQHYCNGKCWHVPENFGFPSNPCFLRIGWHFWLKGMPNFVGIDGTKKQ